MLGSVMGLLFGGWIFISPYKHLLVMLMSLEMMVLGLLWMMSVWMSAGPGEMFFIMFFSVAACEGKMGLAVLVCLVCSHGSSKFEGVSI